MELGGDLACECIGPIRIYVPENMCIVVLRHFHRLAWELRIAIPYIARFACGTRLRTEVGVVA